MTNTMPTYLLKKPALWNTKISKLKGCIEIINNQGVQGLHLGHPCQTISHAQICITDNGHKPRWLIGAKLLPFHPQWSWWSWQWRECFAPTPFARNPRMWWVMVPAQRCKLWLGGNHQWNWHWCNPRAPGRCTVASPDYGRLQYVEKPEYSTYIPLYSTSPAIG